MSGSEMGFEIHTKQISCFTHGYRSTGKKESLQEFCYAFSKMVNSVNAPSLVFTIISPPCALMIS